MSLRSFVVDVLRALAGPRHEWHCPSCGATTRARMADQAPSPSTPPRDR